MGPPTSGASRALNPLNFGKDRMASAIDALDAYLEHCLVKQKGKISGELQVRGLRDFCRATAP